MRRHEGHEKSRDPRTPPGPHRARCGAGVGPTCAASEGGRRARGEGSGAPQEPDLLEGALQPLKDCELASGPFRFPMRARAAAKREWAVPTGVWSRDSQCGTDSAAQPADPSSTDSGLLSGEGPRHIHDTYSNHPTCSDSDTHIKAFLKNKGWQPSRQTVPLENYI